MINFTWNIPVSRIQYENVSLFNLCWQQYKHGLYDTVLTGVCALLVWRCIAGCGGVGVCGCGGRVVVVVVVVGWGGMGGGGGGGGGGVGVGVGGEGLSVVALVTDGSTALIARFMRPHVGPMNFAIWADNLTQITIWLQKSFMENNNKHWLRFISILNYIAEPIIRCQLSLKHSKQTTQIASESKLKSFKSSTYYPCPSFAIL